MLVFYFAFLSLFPTVNTLTEIRGIKDSFLTLEKSGVLNIYLEFLGGKKNGPPCTYK